MTEEDPQTILNELSTTFCRQKFDILFCDETASQSGRILPLEVVSTFCRQHSIKLIVDGTQSCQLLFAKNRHDILDQVKNLNGGKLLILKRITKSTKFQFHKRKPKRDRL